ncbi:4327_t:CDS:2 [Dentiscutata erythropus]|uniref:4327_t:CDS:1 n=1 Tax=Dentiscutata erythropus TaxID=1348616 RepID=A0A9N9C5S7_9GLOM|nr:4327_t:CDS:2 [Dentiscutata erythropus]
MAYRDGQMVEYYYRGGTSTKQGIIKSVLQDRKYSITLGLNSSKTTSITFIVSPEMSYIIECSDNSPLKKIFKDDGWKEINEKHSFRIDVDITISHYLNQLADFLCDDNNIINDDLEMLRPPDNNL